MNRRSSGPTCAPQTEREVKTEEEAKVELKSLNLDSSLQHFSQLARLMLSAKPDAKRNSPAFTCRPRGRMQLIITALNTPESWWHCVVLFFFNCSCYL